MKNVEEIKKDERVTITRQAPDGFCGFVRLKGISRKSDALFVISWGEGWDHLSLSFRDRCPIWKEMCEAKDIFFEEDEVCVQYHPKKSEYINNHSYCLHIFRPQKETLPVPPYWMVGLKPGDTIESIKNHVYGETE